MDEGNKLRRQNGLIAGVCGGLGAFSGVRPFWFRLLFAILLILYGGKVILSYSMSDTRIILLNMHF